MEFVTGVKKKETLELSELLEEGLELELIVKVNGAVHTIRDMGDSGICDSPQKRRTCAVRI